jgi:hypothetical protein
MNSSVGNARGIKDMWPYTSLDRGASASQRGIPVTGRSQVIRLGIHSMSEVGRDRHFGELLRAGPADCGGIEGCFFVVFRAADNPGGEDRYNGVSRYRSGETSQKPTSGPE